MERVYLAGFDVFRQDAVQQGEHLKRVCAHHGMVGIYPLDNELPVGLAGHKAARWVAEQNIRLLRSADAVLANLNNFRGAEPDSGTVYETGVAQALGIPVWAYFGPLK